jgi:hypothetical protein
MPDEYSIAEVRQSSPVLWVGCAALSNLAEPRPAGLDAIPRASCEGAPVRGHSRPRPNANERSEDSYILDDSKKSPHRDEDREGDVGKRQRSEAEPIKPGSPRLPPLDGELVDQNGFRQCDESESVGQNLERFGGRHSVGFGQPGRGQVRCFPACFFTRIASRRRALGKDEFFFLLAMATAVVQIISVAAIYSVVVSSYRGLVVLRCCQMQDSRLSGHVWNARSGLDHSGTVWQTAGTETLFTMSNRSRLPGFRFAFVVRRPGVRSVVGVSIDRQAEA